MIPYPSARHLPAIALPAVGGAALACPLGFLLFPESYWFPKLWMGATTGAAVGSGIGLLRLRFFGTKPKEEILKPLTLFPVGLGVLALFGLVVFLPMLLGEQRELLFIRSLSHDQVSLATLPMAGMKDARPLTSEELRKLTDLMKGAQLFSPDHEPHGIPTLLTITMKDGPPRVYGVGQPSRHLNDIVLVFRAGITERLILVPGGRAWLEGVLAK